MAQTAKTSLVIIEFRSLSVGIPRGRPLAINNVLIQPGFVLPTRENCNELPLPLFVIDKLHPALCFGEDCVIPSQADSLTLHDGVKLGPALANYNVSWDNGFSVHELL